MRPIITKKPNYCPVFVGVAGFEPATSCSQSRRDDRATLHPEDYFLSLSVSIILLFTKDLIVIAERQGLEPWRRCRRQISNLLHYRSGTSPIFYELAAINCGCKCSFIKTFLQNKYGLFLK